jgi:major membrane immunogen (membrane-anchored lipoprotein)
MRPISSRADVLLARDSWRLVEAVTGATSADDLSERLCALISE